MKILRKFYILALFLSFHSDVRTSLSLLNIRDVRTSLSLLNIRDVQFLGMQSVLLFAGRLPLYNGISYGMLKYHIDSIPEARRNLARNNTLTPEELLVENIKQDHLFDSLVDFQKYFNIYYDNNEQKYHFDRQAIKWCGIRCALTALIFIVPCVTGNEFALMTAPLFRFLNRITSLNSLRHAFTNHLQYHIASGEVDSLNFENAHNFLIHKIKERIAINMNDDVITDSLQSRAKPYIDSLRALRRLNNQPMIEGIENRKSTYTQDGCVEESLNDYVTKNQLQMPSVIMVHATDNQSVSHPIDCRTLSAAESYDITQSFDRYRREHATRNNRVCGMDALNHRNINCNNTGKSTLPPDVITQIGDFLKIQKIAKAPQSQEEKSAHDIGRTFNVGKLPESFYTSKGLAPR